MAGPLIMFGNRPYRESSSHHSKKRFKWQSIAWVTHLMTHHQYIKCVLFCFIFILNENLFASEKRKFHPKLSIHGETYENSCSKKQRQILITNIRKNVQHDSRSLQNTIDFILCRVHTTKNTKRMVDIVNEVVAITYDGTGEEKVFQSSKDKMEVLKDVMAEGKAWNASLIFDDNEVKVQYFSSEACVESVKLRRSNNSWVIHEIGSACD